MVLLALNKKEAEFLESSEKKDEYMEHIIKIGLQEKDDAVVIDVGANVGAFSCAIANHLRSNSRIHAIEPFEQTHALLTSNTAFATQVKCHKLAIGTEEGDATGVFLPNYTLLSGFHVSDEDKKNLEKLAGRTLEDEFASATETVPCLRLDSFCKKNDLNGKIDVLKIDVEKAELDVLLSLGDRLKDVQCVVAEVHQPHLDQFRAILEARFGKGSVWVSEEDLPRFALNDDPEEWPDNLSTYIVFAN